MTTVKDFSEYYRTISDTELLTILDNPQDYQTSAVEAAKAEFAKRQLSTIEIEKAREPLIAKQLQKAKEKEKVKAIESKIKDTGYTFIDTINPIQSGKFTTEKTIRFIVIVFSCICLYKFIADFGDNLAYLKDIPRFPFESSIILLPKIFLPIAIITFWKRKIIGWVLMTMFLTFSTVAALWGLFLVFNWSSSGFVVLDDLFPTPSLTTFIIQLVFLIGTLYVLCKKNIREVFRIDKEKMAVTIIITGLLALVLVAAIS